MDAEGFRFPKKIARLREQTAKDYLKLAQHQEKVLQLCNKLNIPYQTLPSPVCQVLDASLYAGKVSLPKGSPQHAFVQDLAASLNRRRILKNEDVESFTDLAIEIIEEK